MASFEFVLGNASVSSALRASEPTVDDVFDVVIDGERFNAASEPEQAACFLRDLMNAASLVLEGRRSKVLVPLCDAPWELCLLPAPSGVAMSFYRTGPVPEVRLLDRAISATEIARQSGDALRRLTPQLTSMRVEELQLALARLEQATRCPAEPLLRGPDMLVRWRSKADGRPVRVAFETVIASHGDAVAGAERADLHALLFRGRLSFDIRGQKGELAPGFVFLQVERLLSMCRPVLDAFTARRALHLRVATGNSMLSLRMSADGRLSMTIARPSAASFTAPALDARDFVMPVCEAALSLARAVVRCDRSRSRNLRLRALRMEARTVRRRARSLDQSESKVNHDPAPYRASAESVPPASHTEVPRPALDLSESARLRYNERWRAEIEGLDLTGTLLCGDRLVVPGNREIAAIDRRTGEKLWSRALPRAATALAGNDILRMTPRGDVELRDVRDGEVVWSTRLAPRVGAAGFAFTIHALGLPRCVVLAEGERHLVSLDLRTGEPRWRFGARHGGNFRLRRAGRLLYVAAADTSVTAVDIASGETVWRHVAAAPFHSAPAVHRDIVASPAGVRGKDPVRIFANDAYTGELRWIAELGVPLASSLVGAADTFVATVCDREAVSAVFLDAQTGTELARIPLTSRPLPGTTVALNAFDDLVVANLPTGRVVAIDARDRTIRWARMLNAPLADDTPRRLDAQLRAGALFVPQSSLAVLRPRDGAPIANIDACNLVPDLVRIDEECAVYVAEDSGHLGAYELAARLSLVVEPVAP